MDYPEQRQKYLRVYPTYLIDLVLTTNLLHLVRRLSPILWEENENPSEWAIRSYILLELTKTRESCTQVIHFLRESDVAQNIVIADGLQKFNTSPGRRTFGNEIEIPVTPVLSTEIKLPNTRNYSMIKKTRGKAIIINVVSNEVQFEAQRFFYVFKQMLFEPKMYFSLTTDEIKEYLKTIAEDLRDKIQEFMDEALIVMIITHGMDESFVGSNHPACGGKDKNDIVPIVDIVDIFAKLENIIKMFFFTCCRNINKEHRNPKDMNCSKKDGSDNNINTYVFYSSAEGYETLHDSFYTVSGRTLSESLAQYSHCLSLTEIINKTNLVLCEDYHDDSKALWNSVGYFAPENKQKCITRNLYFNPGWYEGKNESKHEGRMRVGGEIIN